MLGFPDELIKCNILCTADQNQQPLGRHLPQECPSWCISTPAVFSESDPCHLTWCGTQRTVTYHLLAQEERSGVLPTEPSFMLPKGFCSCLLISFPEGERESQSWQATALALPEAEWLIRQSDIQGEETSAGLRGLANP